MHIIARRTLTAFYQRNVSAKGALEAWYAQITKGEWKTLDEIQQAFPKSKVLDGERVRFAVKGNDYRLIVAFDLERRVGFVKFVGTHAEYDKIEARTVSDY